MVTVCYFRMCIDWVYKGHRHLCYKWKDENYSIVYDNNFTYIYILSLLLEKQLYLFFDMKTYI